jgi:hypothetical protein
MTPPPPPPVPPHAWCYVCNGLRQYAGPLPPVRAVTVLLTPSPGARVSSWLDRWPAAPASMVITVREGTCIECGGPISRVGGGRAADGPFPTEDGSEDDAQPDLFA